MEDRMAVETLPVSTEILCVSTTRIEFDIEFDDRRGTLLDAVQLVIDHERRDLLLRCEAAGIDGEVFVNYELAIGEALRQRGIDLGRSPALIKAANERAARQEAPNA